MLKGWDLLTAKFREFGVQQKTNEKRDGNKARENDAKDINLDDFGKKGFSTQKKSFVEIMKDERSQHPNTIWMDVGERMSRDEMDEIQFGWELGEPP